MKKLTVILAAVVMGFMLASCGGPSIVDQLNTEVDNFFAQAEQKLSAIDNGDDFLQFWEGMEEERENFLNGLQEKFGEQEITDEQMEQFKDHMYERSSAYNKLEAEKAAEFLTPLVEQYETAVEAIVENVGQVDEDAWEALTEDFENAEVALRPYAEYDNVLPELQERLQTAEAKLNDVINSLIVE